MKITFICSSLQPGNDGVGDHVRRLAQEIMESGHEVEAIALMDTHISAIEEGTQATGYINLPVLRLPATLNTADRYKYLDNRINKFGPDLVSLQYVGFGFHKYGLPIDILLNLRKAIGSRKLHLMLHELWCGMAVNAGLKERVLGITQKFFLKALIAVLKPESIFTSIQPYLVFLKSAGIAATVVPIFGNIPVNEFGGENDWEDLITKADLSPLILEPQKWLILGFFGTTYNCPGLDELLKTAFIAAKAAGLKLGVLVIGHNRGQNTQNLVKAVHEVSYWQTGSLSPAMINRVMQLVSIGVVTSPVDGINKSGSAIAWMERGIPVMISAADKTYEENVMKQQGIYQAITPGEIIKAYNVKNQLEPQCNLKKAAIAYTVNSL